MFSALALVIFFICSAQAQKSTPYTSKLVQLSSLAQQQGLLAPGDILFPNDFGVNEMVWLSETQYQSIGGMKFLQADGVR